MSATVEALPTSIRRIDEEHERNLAVLAKRTRKTLDEAVAARVELIDASTLKPEPIRWIWPGWIAGGKLLVLAGAPGTGKTTIVMQLVACVSAERAFPGGFRPPRAGRALIWSGEDDPTDTLLPRLIAAGADLSLVTFIGEVRENSERRYFDPARDVPKLAAAIAGMDDVALIVIDPLVSAVSGDSHKNAEVRRGLAPLVELAAKIGAALIGITHYSKGAQGRDPLERVSGSLAFGALARIVLGTVKLEAEEGQPQRMMLARAKSNIGPDGGGFTYVIEQTELQDGVTTSRIAWGSAVEGTARELLSEPEHAEANGDDAADFLRSLLARGSCTAKEIYREAESAGYSRDQMKRAKRRAGVEAVKVGMAGGWEWRLHEGRAARREGRAESSEGSEGSGQKTTARFAEVGKQEDAAPFTPFAENALPSEPGAQEGDL